MSPKAWSALLALLLSPLGCQRTGPCAAYDRSAENIKDGARITYCLARNGRAVGPYTCTLEDGSGSVQGQFDDGKKHGTWTFRADGGAVVRRETWQHDRKVSSEELEPELPPLPEGVKSVRCDAHVIRWREP